MLQKQIAYEIGIGISHYNKIENGQQEASVKNLDMVVSFYDLTIDDIVHLDGEIPKEVTIEDKSLSEQVNLIQELDEKDRNIVFNIIDTMLTKRKFKDFLIKTLLLYNIKIQMRRIITLLLSLFVLFSCYSQNLSNEHISKDLSNMLISDEYTFEIISISEATNNLCIVCIIPPYREFPNILLYSYNEKSKGWERIIEGLSIGIQPEPSGLLDLHTINSGLDFTFDSHPIIKFNNELKTTIKESTENHSIIIPYQYFLHMHSSPSVKSFYTIDKTSYYDLANVLFNNQYKDFPKEECTMYDTPFITKSALSYNQNEFEIIAETSNNQLWSIKFKGIDSENQYLLEKNISVKNK